LASLREIVVCKIDAPEPRLADTDENGNADNAGASQRGFPQIIFLIFL